MHNKNYRVAQVTPHGYKNSLGRDSECLPCLVLSGFTFGAKNETFIDVR